VGCYSMASVKMTFASFWVSQSSKNETLPLFNPALLLNLLFCGPRWTCLRVHFMRGLLLFVNPYTFHLFYIFGIKNHAVTSDFGELPSRCVYKPCASYALENNRFHTAPFNHLKMKRLCWTAFSIRKLLSQTGPNFIGWLQ